MNELMELGLVVSETPAPNRDTLRDDELRELGLVVVETKGHCHGSNWDRPRCPTTAGGAF